MKASQIFALSAALIMQAQACVRVRVDRYVEGNYGTVQSIKLYDNDDPYKTIGFPINFSTADEATTLKLDDYSVTLRYKNHEGAGHPYGGTIGYPKGPDADLQGKAGTQYFDEKGRLHNVYCFSDNYSNCGAYTCGV